MTGERVDPVVPLDPDTRDAIRDLCEGVAILAVRCAPMIGTDDAGVVCGLAKRLSERMDALDQENPDG